MALSLYKIRPNYEILSKIIITTTQTNTKTGVILLSYKIIKVNGIGLSVRK